MSERVEVQYRDLLTPIKDPEKSFCVNISELLHSYITNFVQGRIPPNFNSAALLLQGSSSIYAKKVEYLHNLALQLYQILVNNKKEETSKKTTKEREKNNREKENKLNDPFFSIEIKPGKNLSCLRRKRIVPSTTKKGGKKADGQKFIFVPVDLLPLEGEEKGDVFYDTRGDMVGNRNDFALNKCRVTHSGWLLLPTVSPESVPSPDAPPDYTDDFLTDPGSDGACEDMDCDSMPQCTPVDEGYVPGSPGSTPASSQEPCSQPLTEDEGLGSLPCTPDENPLSSSPAEGDGESPFPSQGTDLESPSEGIENVPMECIDTNVDLAVRPVRRSMRQALKLCQLEQQELQNEENENVPEPPEKEAVKKAIQKKNTCNLPSKLKAGDENMCITPASGYCARTFFSMDNKIFKGAILKCGVTAFGINSKLCKRLGDHYELMSTRNRNKKKMAEILVQEEESVDVVGIDDVETAQDDAAPDVAMETPLDDEDIVVTNDPILPPPSDDLELPNTEEMNMLPPPSTEDPEIDEGMLIESFSAASHHLITNALTGIDKNADISRKVHEWEQTIKPYLDELDHREQFDINLYGSRILNSFEDSNRKQTTTFKNFCKGKEKWEVHRYFMALLPLVNIGNVSIESGTNNSGEEDIFVTLLSRKMHHKELEEFGHNEGGHS